MNLWNSLNFFYVILFLIIKKSRVWYFIKNKSALNYEHLQFLSTINSKEQFQKLWLNVWNREVQASRKGFWRSQKWLKQSERQRRRLCRPHRIPVCHRPLCSSPICPANGKLSTKRQLRESLNPRICVDWCLRKPLRKSSYQRVRNLRKLRKLYFKQRRYVGANMKICAKISVSYHRCANCANS